MCFVITHRKETERTFDNRCDLFKGRRVIRRRETDSYKDKSNSSPISLKEGAKQQSLDTEDNYRK